MKFHKALRMIQVSDVMSDMADPPKERVNASGGERSRPLRRRMTAFAYAVA
jgi:hypothetical protein